MIKNLKIAFFILFLCIPLVFFSIFAELHFNRIMSRGLYFFDKTINSHNLYSVILEDSNGHKVTLIAKNNLWRINEIDDYYASFPKINSLIKLLSKSVIYRADKLLESNIQLNKRYVKIKTLDNLGNVIDDAIIYDKNSNNKYYYAIRGNSEYIYQIDGSLDLSANPLDWVQLPLLSINISQINRISDGKNYVFRDFANDDFRTDNKKLNQSQVNILTNNLQYLSISDAVHAYNFDINKFKRIRRFKISEFSGIIYYIDLFKNNEDESIWVSIKLETSFISEPSSVTKLKETQILYNGWFFKIDNTIGNAINNVILK